MSTRTTGIGLAFVTSIVSGVAIYVNGHAVRHFGDATVYTTAKNAVAGVLLLALAAAPGRVAVPAVGRQRRSLAYLSVAVLGGSVPFVLFFEGLARAEATQAGFIQKTLVIWVAALAVPLLHERFRLPHLVAVAFLVGGQAWLVGSTGTIAFGTGEAMIVGATLLWAVEVVWVRRLLSASRLQPRALAAARMACGSCLLVAWVAVNGHASQLTSLDAAQWRWVVVTGLLLTAYVGTWYAALARAQAVDVTAVLVFGAVVTALLADGVRVNVGGAGLIGAGTLVVALAALRAPARVST